MVAGAIRLPDQARFHPLHYLKGMLQFVLDKGGVVYEHTMIGEKVDKEDRITLYTEGSEHQIRCRHAISASHFPFMTAEGCISHACMQSVPIVWPFSRKQILQAECT